MTVDFRFVSDESLLAYYESIRRQAAADTNLGGKRRLAGDGVRRYAKQLQKEMQDRRLRYIPIEWR
jgi:hypothetical protein